MSLLKTIWFAFVVVLVTFIHFLALVLLFLSSKLLGREVPQNKAHNITNSWGQVLFGLIPGWKLDLQGKEFLPKENEPCVYVANHESAADIFILCFLGVQFRWLAKEAVFRIPMVGQGMRWAGYISLTRGDKESHSKALQKGAEYLKNKTSMLFFPEGTRHTVGKPQTFKVGAFKLAKDEHVPIVPVVLHGAGTLMKKHTYCPHNATVRVQVLPPMTCREEESISEFTQRVQETMVAHHQHLVSRQPMVP